MPISINSSTGTLMNDGNTLSRSQTAAILPDLLVDTGSLLQIKSGVSFDGDSGITTVSDPSFRLAKADNVYTKYDVISATSTWTVPSGVTKGYVIVVSGGNPGSAGTTTSDSFIAGTPGARGSAVVSFIPLTPANTMPATVGAASGTSTFFGISAVTGGTSTPGNLFTGTVETVWPVNHISANSVGSAAVGATAMGKSTEYINSGPGGVLYNMGNTLRPGAGGQGRLSQLGSASPGLPGAIIIFY